MIINTRNIMPVATTISFEQIYMCNLICCNNPNTITNERIGWNQIWIVNGMLNDVRINLKPLKPMFAGIVLVFAPMIVIHHFGGIRRWLEISHYVNALLSTIGDNNFKISIFIGLSAILMIPRHNSR